MPRQLGGRIRKDLEPPHDGVLDRPKNAEHRRLGPDPADPVGRLLFNVLGDGRRV
jgi:hypothetical protein